MSFILDALRKSERERRATQVPDLAAVVHEPAQRRVPWLLIAGILLLLINLTGLGYWVFLAEPRDPRPAASVPVEVERAVLSPPATALSSLPPSRPDLAPPSNRLAAPSLPDAPMRPPAIMPERLLPPANPPRFQESEDEAIDRELETESPARFAEFHPSVLPNRAVLPRLDELSPEVREKIPPFKITMFAYDENPAERFVILNLEKRHVGDVLPGGVLLIEIRSEELIGEIDGQKFRIPRF